MVISYIFYVNDLGKGSECTITKFVDDTKIGGKATGEDDTESLQRDRKHFSAWAKAWQMKHNVGKCEVMHISRKNKGAEYYLNRERLQKAAAPRDLGVLEHESEKADMQLQQLLRKTNGM